MSTSEPHPLFCDLTESYLSQRARVSPSSCSHRSLKSSVFGAPLFGAFRSYRSHHSDNFDIPLFRGILSYRSHQSDILVHNSTSLCHRYFDVPKSLFARVVFLRMDYETWQNKSHGFHHHNSDFPKSRSLGVSSHEWFALAITIILEIPRPALPGGQFPRMVRLE